MNPKDEDFIFSIALHRGRRCAPRRRPLQHGGLRPL